MERELVDQLINLNREFYGQFAVPFAETRRSPQPGFYSLMEHVPIQSEKFLDIGCGDARFIRFLMAHAGPGEYCGVDFSSAMLQLAIESTEARFYNVDLNSPGCLAEFGHFDVISCLATLQHIPGHQNRIRLMKEIGLHIREGGRIFLSNWQFLDSPRQSKKIIDWKEIGVDISELESNDFLIAWNRGGYGHRYVAQVDIDETYTLAKKAGLRVVDSFRSDGKEGNLNLYTVLTSE